MSETRSKYGSKKAPCSVCQATHDSLKERQRCWELAQWEKRGRISCVQRQVRFRLTVKGQYICAYVADFVYLNERGETVVEDTKGYRTPLYKLKAKLMRACLGIDIRET